jgi:Tetracyclin repressor-like, C-terminal domain
MTALRAKLSLPGRMTEILKTMKTSGADAEPQMSRISCPAAVGQARDDALIAMARAWRAWALAHPGRYQAAQRPPAPGDADDEAVSGRAIQVLEAVMDGYGLDGDDAIRAFRATLHGFVSLEASGAFAFPASVDHSFDRLVQALVRALSSWAGVPEPGREAQA